MNDFLGLVVKITLLNGTIYQGTVSHLDTSQQILTLLDAFSSHAPSLRVPMVQVRGVDIADLSIIPATKQPTPKVSTQEPVIQFSDYKKSSSKKTKSEKESGSKDRLKSKTVKKQTFSDTGNADDLSQDFDFQGSLALFDKVHLLFSIEGEYFCRN